MAMKRAGAARRVSFVVAVVIVIFVFPEIKPRYLNYVGRTDSALTLPLISRDPTPCMAETALAMVNI